MDTTYGLGYAKLAQVLLEQGRTLEALEAIGEAARRGGDPFFIAAIRGDIYAEMERHPEAAEAYDQALAIDPEDHWALHQAALEHGFAGTRGVRRSCSRRRSSTIAKAATRRSSTTAITCAASGASATR
jgi:tetratricopeptide (TPR) repeat protein